MSESLTLHEAAKLLGRRPSTLRDYVRDDGLPHRREGHGARIVIDRAELEAWAARPEIRAMLCAGDIRKGLVPARA